MHFINLFEKKKNSPSNHIGGRGRKRAGLGIRVSPLLEMNGNLLKLIFI